jgi:predicted nuclease of predicted toxin-antitoxin system
MRLLLDENMPTLFRADFGPEYEAHTVRSMGWLGKKNGELLALMVAHGFEALITIDKNLYRQQNLVKAGVSVILLRVFNSKLATLQLMLPQLKNLLSQPLAPGITILQQSRNA